MAFYQTANIQPLNPGNPVLLLNQKIDYLNSGFQQPSSIPSLTNITGGAHTYTAAELLNRYTVRSALPSNPVTDTMPTSTQIVTALNNYQTNNQHSYLTRGTPINTGFYFDWTLINNDAADTLVVNGNTGVTFLYGSSLTVLPSSYAVLRITVTNVSSPAVTVAALSNTSSGSTVTDVSNVAALKALNVTYVSDGSLIRTTGYYTTDDGGQGTYVYSSSSTATDNGGSVIAPNSGSGRYLLLISNVINPAQFGMMGIEGVGQNLLAAPDSRMTLGWTGYNNWGFAGNASPINTSFQTVSFSGGFMNITLKAVPSGGQTIALSRFLPPTGVRPAGRYLVQLDARCSAGTSVALFIGKSSVDLNAQLTFTPTGTLTTYSGWFDSEGGSSSQSVYIGLKNNGDANGSQYQITSVEIYYQGESSATKPPLPADAPDETTRFRQVVAATVNGNLTVNFNPRRFYKVVGSSPFTLGWGTRIDLNGSELHISNMNACDGLQFEAGGSVTNGKISSSTLVAGTDRGLIASTQTQNTQPLVGIPSGLEVKRLEIDHDVSGQNFCILSEGTVNTVIGDIYIRKTLFTRRLIGVVWSGPVNTAADPNNASLGNHPGTNCLIEDIYSEECGQGWPASGGGAIVSVNGMTNCTIRNVYGENCGRSIVTIGAGDRADSQFEIPAQNKGTQSYVVQNCVGFTNSIGYRTGGSQLLTSTTYSGMNTVFDNCVSISLDSASDSGFVLEGSQQSVIVRNCRTLQHKNGIANLGRYGDGSGSGVSNEKIDLLGNLIEESREEGILLQYVQSGMVRENRIYDSGTALTAGKRSAIHVTAGCRGLTIEDNHIGRIGEATTSQNVGIEVDSSATILNIAVSHNIISGAAAAGTPIIYGSLAGYAIKGNNYSGTQIVEVNTVSPSLANTVDFSILQALGSATLGQSLGSAYLSNVVSALTLADNTFYSSACWVPRDCVLTGIKFVQNTQGSYTGDQNNRFGLYTYSAGTLTLVASSTNNASLWTGANDTLVTVPFTTTYTATAGLYFVGFSVNWSAVVTAPQLKSASVSLPLATLDFTNNAKIAPTNTGYNDIPASVTMLSLSNAVSRVPFILLY